MVLSRQDVEKVSLLARLHLDDRELATMTEQLGQILDYMRRLDEVATDDVEPLAHALDIHDVLRDDVVLPSLPREQALANAPNHDTQYYRVPPVLS